MTSRKTKQPSDGVDSGRTVERAAAVSDVESPPVAAAEPSFEQAMAELEDVVAELEGGQASLQDSLRLFARGVELVRVCQKQLAVASEQVRQLLTQEDGQVTAVPLPAHLAGGGPGGPGEGLGGGKAEG